MDLAKWTFGMGDRFGHQGEAQLRAVMAANAAGASVAPVWNKSNREHLIVGTHPTSLRAEADAAVAALGWTGAYYVDADHINLGTVERFLECSDFFTLDVAESVGKAAEPAAVDAFIAAQKQFLGELSIPGLAEPFRVTTELLRAIAGKYLAAAQQAGAIYRHLAQRKGAGNFVTEVSIDETDQPQTPVELFFILAMLAAEGVPAQTVAPKFTGRFNKGVDYVGDLAQFEREFEADLHVIAYAIARFGLPADLKLSVHSGSDKFSLYPIIRRLIAQHGAGLHLKTAGTTWLEEVIGLAEAGGEGLAIAKDIYRGALGRFEALTAPYATVIDIDRSALPTAATVDGWTSADFVAALRHDPSCPAYHRHLRQLIHVGFKVAAEMGTRYTDALKSNAEIVARNVTGNLYERHLRPLFV